MTTDPFEALNTKRVSGARKVILGIGDSTFIGAGSGNDGGWLTRLGKDIGAADNINVFWKAWDEVAGWTSTWTQIYTGTSGNGALYIYDGAMGGHDLIAMNAWVTGAKPSTYRWSTSIASGFVAEQPDLIFQGSVVNDCVQPSDGAVGFPATPVATYMSRYDTLIGNIQSAMPNIPVVIVTQNAWEPAGLFCSDATFAGYQAACAAHIGIPSPTIPFSPTLQQANTTSYPGVWMWDTRQAFSGGWDGTGTGNHWTDQYHLNAAGNQVQADWMYGYLNASLSNLQLAPTITTTVLNPLVRGVPFSQTLTGNAVTTAHWSLLTGGSYPAGLATITDSGTIAGTPTSYGGSYDFWVRVTNAYGYADQRFTGTVSPNASAFTGNGLARFKQSGLGGNFYPVTPKVEVSGSFVPVLPRSTT